MSFWFNVNTGEVEEDSEKSPVDRLMGPFDSREAAGRALAQAREKTERWDAQDKAWDDAGLED